MSVGADDFAQLFATKERYRCGMPLAGTVRPSPPQRIAPLYEKGGKIAEGNQGGEDMKTPPVMLRMTAPSS